MEFGYPATFANNSNRFHRLELGDGFLEFLVVEHFATAFLMRGVAENRTLIAPGAFISIVVAVHFRFGRANSFLPDLGRVRNVRPPTQVEPQVIQWANPSSQYEVNQWLALASFGFPCWSF